MLDAATPPVRPAWSRERGRHLRRRPPLTSPHIPVNAALSVNDSSDLQLPTKGPGMRRLHKNPPGPHCAAVRMSSWKPDHGAGLTPRPAVRHSRNPLLRSLQQPRTWQFNGNSAMRQTIRWISGASCASSESPKFPTSSLKAI